MTREISYAIRTLLRTPTPTFTAVVILALGIGAATAMFSVANSVLFRPLPFTDPERLVEVGTVGILEFQAYRQQARSFESLVSYSAVNRNLDAAGGLDRISAVAAERGLFDLLGVRPLSGRTFRPDDPADVAVVSEGFWRRRFGGRPPLDDWKIVLDGRPYTVTGVMPSSFQFPYRTTETEVWIPTDLPPTDNWSQRIDVALGRLKPGVTTEAASAELRAISRRIRPRQPQGPDRAVPITPLTEAVVGRSRKGVLTLLGAVAMVLLIACANVANLLLVRAERRRREVAVRTALGAGRGRLFAQFLTESIVLALAASAAAVFVAVGLTRWLATLAAPRIPRALEIGPDWTTFLFLLVVGTATGVVFGMVPALQAATSEVTGMLGATTTTGGRRSRGRGSVTMNGGLVVVEVALAFILLTGAGLLLRASILLEGVPTGVVAERVLTMRMETVHPLPGPPAEPGSTVSAQGRYFRAIEERVSALPGVRAAGFVTKLHVQSPGNTGEFTVIGAPAPENGHGAPVRLREASPGYFRALGIPLRAGRMVTGGEPGIIVNETLVRQHFPAGVDPIGRALDRGTIIGVVGDVRQRLRLPSEPEIYRPIAATGYSAATLVVSASMPAEGLAGPVRAAIRDVNPAQTVYDVKTMNQVINESHEDVELSLWIVGGFAGLAFALSVAGVYAVLSYAVAARRQEFGIRLALGADSGRLFRLVLTQAGRLIAAGVALGIAGSVALTRALDALLYEVSPTDPLTFTAAAVVLSGVAMTACLNPARRAAKLDPMIVLRHE